MSFADRLKKFTATELTAGAARGPIELCHPQMVFMRGRPMGLLHMELAPMVVGGAAALQLLAALVDLFNEIDRAPDGVVAPESARELAEAMAHLRQHLKSVSAAADLAHAEHQVLKRAGKEPLQ